MARASSMPPLAHGVGRTLVVAGFNAAALWLLSLVVPGFTIEDRTGAALAGALVCLANALVWPTLARLTLPLTTLTLGVGALALNAVMVTVLFGLVPGVELAGIGTAVVVTLGLSTLASIAAAVLFIDDDIVFDQRSARLARRRRRRGRAEATDRPGVVFLQIDGLSIDVLRRARRSGDVPTIDRWLRTGTHRLISWETGWSSQTGVSQAGLLLGSTEDMPGFRWYDKATGEVVVSNLPASAAWIEARQLGRGGGLLAQDGASFGNLFTGGAERAALTLSAAGRRKEGGLGAGYGAYFSHPYNILRTMVAFVVEVVRERRAAIDQSRRDVRPRVRRTWTYACLRAFATVVLRDVCVHAVIGEIAGGRSRIFVDFIGYDEVAHHSGVERHDTMATLRDIDRQVARIDRALTWAPRPYEIVVLSDHGQSQGATFRDRYGHSLEELVRARPLLARLKDDAKGAVSTEARGYLDSALEEAGTGAGVGSRVARSARRRFDVAEAEARVAPAPVPPSPEEVAAPIVLASGNLALVSFPDIAGRATAEDIEAHHPGLIDQLVSHPGVGFVLVRTRARGSLVLGARGVREVATGAVTGDDPLAPFGAAAAAQVAAVDGYASVADLMVNSMVDPETGEVAAFEELVGSHGGLGGDQTRAFLVVPAAWNPPTEPLVGAEVVHRQLLRWLSDERPAGEVDREEMQAPSTAVRAEEEVIR